jgi:hypothetical protein
LFHPDGVGLLVVGRATTACGFGKSLHCRHFGMCGLACYACWILQTKSPQKVFQFFIFTPISAFTRKNKKSGGKFSKLIKTI